MLRAALTGKYHTPARLPLFRTRATYDAFLMFDPGKQVLFRRGIACGDGGGCGHYIRAVESYLCSVLTEQKGNNQQAGQQGKGRDITPPSSSRCAIVAEITGKPVPAGFQQVAALSAEIRLIKNVGHIRELEYLWGGPGSITEHSRLSNPRHLIITAHYPRKIVPRSINQQ